MVNFGGELKVKDNIFLRVAIRKEENGNGSKMKVTGNKLLGSLKQ